MAVGLGLSQPPVTLLNTMDSFSQKYIVPLLGDVTFLPSPTFWALTRYGKKFHGSELIYPIVTAEEMTGGAYYGDQLLDTAVVDSVQPANQVWRHYRQSLSVPITDLILNRGGPGGMDLLAAKYQIACASFLQKLSRALWKKAPQNTTNDVDSLVDWIKSTTNTIAGINRSTVTAWQPAANGAGGGGNLTDAIATDFYFDVVYGYDEPDILIMDNTRFSKFRQAYQGLVRFTENQQDEEAVQAGFRYHFLFNNCVVLADRNAPAQEAYFMNSKYIFPVFHENDYFAIDPWIKPSNQRVAVSTVYLTWQVSSVSPRMLKAVTNLA